MTLESQSFRRLVLATQIRSTCYQKTWPIARRLASSAALAVDSPALRASLDALAADVRTAFIRHVGEIKVGEIKG
jgi:hypothetical protein